MKEKGLHNLMRFYSNGPRYFKSQSETTEAPQVSKCETTATDRRMWVTYLYCRRRSQYKPPQWSGFHDSENESLFARLSSALLARLSSEQIPRCEIERQEVLRTWPKSVHV